MTKTFREHLNESSKSSKISDIIKVIKDDGDFSKQSKVKDGTRIDFTDSKGMLNQSSEYILVDKMGNVSLININTGKVSDTFKSIELFIKEYTK